MLKKWWKKSEIVTFVLFFCGRIISNKFMFLLDMFIIQLGLVTFVIAFLVLVCTEIKNYTKNPESIASSYLKEVFLLFCQKMYRENYMLLSI